MQQLRQSAKAFCRTINVRSWRRTCCTQIAMQAVLGDWCWVTRVSVKRRLGFWVGVFFFAIFFGDFFGNRFFLAEKLSVGYNRKSFKRNYEKNMELCMWPNLPSVSSFSCKKGHVVNHEVFAAFFFDEHGGRMQLWSARKSHSLLVIWVHRFESLICEGKSKILRTVPPNTKVFLQRLWLWRNSRSYQVLLETKIKNVGSPAFFGDN